MTYSPTEIKNIQQLARDADLKNVLLAFELIRGRGIVSQLVTDIYWIYNRMVWASEENLAQEVYIFFRPYWSAQLDFGELAPILSTPFSLKQSLHPDFEFQAMMLKLDLNLIATQLFEQFQVNYNPVNSFLFKYGTESMQEQILPWLKKREHTGRFLLDLGGFKLKSLPPVILKEKNIQTLKIWGNELTTLPDFWEQFKLLEVLNIAENKLSSLPPSFTTLNKLQKLYAQNNAFDVETIFSSIKQLPNIKYLSVASPINDFNPYSSSENAQLQQFEELVNHGKIHATEKEQWLILGLYLDNKEALQQLSLSDVFDALSDSNQETRKRAKTRLLNWEGARFEEPLKAGDAVAILGIVSFATRNKLNQAPYDKIAFTTEINSNTTHLLIGDYPGQHEVLNERSFIFMTEKDL